MKKISKAVSILLLAFMLISVITPVLAVGPDPTNYQGNNSVTTDKIDSLGNQIITIVSTIGSIASVIVLIVLGSLLLCTYAKKGFRKKGDNPARNGI